MTKGNFMKIAITCLLLGNAALSNAQVTIGSATPPDKFSLLDLNTSQAKKALHLPRLTTEHRDALVNPASVSEDKALAVGLIIYNTDNNCLEFWNSSRWVAFCDEPEPDEPEPCAGLSEMDFVFCDNLNLTIADLDAHILTAGGNGTILWYDAEVDGNLLEPSTALTSGIYYADNCAGSNPRVPIKVTLEYCGELPTQSSDARITTFVNVMYDFQHQILEAYHTNTGTIITNYKWLVSTDNQNFSVLPNGTSSTFEVPPYFIENYVTDEKSKELNFRCILTTSTGTLTTIPLDIYFIRTNTEGYGIDENGVRYLTMNRAASSADPNGNTTIKVALLNLGASGTGSWLNGVHVSDNGILNDAGDLGDFYQWGRVADGHQHTVWSKDASRINTIEPMSGDGATSRVVNRNASSQTYNVNGQIASTNTNFYGRFIINTTGDWGRGSAGIGGTGNSDLWGNGIDSHSGSPVNLSGWTVRGQANNPCPVGWYIPSRFDFSDMHTDSNNTWTWRAMQSNTNAFGGIIITNNHTGEELFLPATGSRNTSQSGNLSLGGGSSHYWSSTLFGELSARSLLFTRTSMNTNQDYNRANGFSVRCVSE